MKKIITLSLSAIMLFAVTFQTACIGSFNLTNGYWDWANNIGNKWVNWLVYLVTAWIAQPIALFVDALILNSIEFWTGSNPMAMGPQDEEKQLVMGADGNNYEIKATMNRFDIKQLDGDKVGAVQSLVFDPELRTWSYVDEVQVIKLAQLSENGATVQIYGSNGQVAIVPTNITDKAHLAAIVEDQLDINLALVK